MRASIALLLLTACGAPAATSSTTRTSADARPVWTGDVSEDAFVQLHERTTETAPAARGEDLRIGDDRAYLSLPEGEPRAAIIVIHEWWGLDDHIRHWADRLAADGYAALAVDLYGGRSTTDPAQAMELMRAVDPERAITTLRAAVAFMETDPRVAPAQTLGVIGWCFGGGWALEAALQLPDAFDAAVVYYGRPVVDVERLRALRAPLLGIFGDLDDSIPPERVDEFAQALESAGATHEILRFDAPHAFANPSGPRYDREAAGAAWEATRAFLARTLRPGG